ncbi:MAG: hypothetical protein JWP81_1997 [Ferruginibacter sp.]|nr:hypothetical protein [Ferruginibacter sp.]
MHYWDLALALREFIIGYRNHTFLIAIIKNFNNGQAFLLRKEISEAAQWLLNPAILWHAFL